MSRLNPLNEVTEPMHRLERAMTSMRDDMAPIQTLPDVLASLQRVEALLERLVEIQEAEAAQNGVITPAPASRRGGQRKRAASA